MASVRQALRIPDDFRDTIIAMHLDPAVMLQYIVDEGNFYCDYAKEDDGGRLAIGEYMKKFSTANQIAYSYTRSRREKERIACIIDEMLHKKEMFLPRTAEQTALRNAWQHKLILLQTEMNIFKSAPKRFPVIRAFMQDWCKETHQLNEKILLEQSRKQPASNRLLL